MIKQTHSDGCVHTADTTTVADPAMGGPGAPIDQNLGLAMAARSSLPQTLGQVSLKSLTFGHFFARKWTKSFQLQRGF